MLLFSLPEKLSLNNNKNGLGPKKQPKSIGHINVPDYDHATLVRTSEF